MNHDHTTKEIEIQRKISMITNEESKDGKVVVLYCKKISIDDVNYIWDEKTR